MKCQVGPQHQIASYPASGALIVAPAHASWNFTGAVGNERQTRPGTVQELVAPLSICAWPPIPWCARLARSGAAAAVHSAHDRIPAASTHLPHPECCRRPSAKNPRVTQRKLHQAQSIHRTVRIRNQAPRSFGLTRWPASSQLSSIQPAVVAGAGSSLQSFSSPWGSTGPAPDPTSARPDRPCSKSVASVQAHDGLAVAGLPIGNRPRKPDATAIARRRSGMADALAKGQAPTAAAIWWRSPDHRSRRSERRNITILPGAQIRFNTDGIAGFLALRNRADESLMVAVPNAGSAGYLVPYNGRILLDQPPVDRRHGAAWTARRPFLGTGLPPPGGLLSSTRQRRWRATPYPASSTAHQAELQPRDARAAPSTIQPDPAPLATPRTGAEMWASRRRVRLNAERLRLT